jgi:hypothetical protein
MDFPDAVRELKSDVAWEGVGPVHTQLLARTGVDPDAIVLVRS